MTTTVGVGAEIAFGGQTIPIWVRDVSAVDVKNPVLEFSLPPNTTIDVGSLTAFAQAAADALKLDFTVPTALPEPFDTLLNSSLRVTSFYLNTGTKAFSIGVGMPIDKTLLGFVTLKTVSVTVTKTPDSGA